MIGFFVAAVVVTLLQLLRTHDPRLLPLLGLFAFLALAHSRGEWDTWGRRFHFAAGFCGLGQLAVLARPRPSAAHATSVPNPPEGPSPRP